MSGFVFIHREILDWDWYKDVNVKVLFLHCILKANWESKDWKGIPIDRGQFVTSVDGLAFELSLSVSQIRTAIDKLKKAGEITIKTTNKFTLLTVEKYDDYQKFDVNDSKQKPKQKTIKTATTKEYNKLKIIDIDMSIVPEDLHRFLTIAQSFQKVFIFNLKSKKAPFKNQEDATFDNYVTPIRLMIESDKVTVEDLRDVKTYLLAPQSEFWKKNVLSTSTLRKQMTKLLMAARPDNTKSNDQSHSNKVAFKFSLDETDVGGTQ